MSFTILNSNGPFKLCSFFHERKHDATLESQNLLCHHFSYLKIGFRILVHVSFCLRDPLFYLKSRNDNIITSEYAANDLLGTFSLIARNVHSNFSYAENRVWFEVPVHEMSTILSISGSLMRQFSITLPCILIPTSSYFLYYLFGTLKIVYRNKQI